MQNYQFGPETVDYNAIAGLIPIMTFNQNGGRLEVNTGLGDLVWAYCDQGSAAILKKMNGAGTEAQATIDFVRERTGADADDLKLAEKVRVKVGPGRQAHTEMVDRCFIVSTPRQTVAAITGMLLAGLQDPLPGQASLVV